MRCRIAALVLGLAGRKCRAWPRTRAEDRSVDATKPRLSRFALPFVERAGRLGQSDEWRDRRLTGKDRAKAVGPTDRAGHPNESISRQKEGTVRRASMVCSGLPVSCMTGVSSCKEEGEQVRRCAWNRERGANTRSSNDPLRH